jgi:transposase-like protein
MRCIGCGSAAVAERPERTAQGYRRFRCRACGKQFNERSGGVLNRAQFPSDVIALVVLWRLRYTLSLRKRKLTAAYHVCASSGMLPAPDEIGLMSISR